MERPPDSLIRFGNGFKVPKYPFFWQRFLTASLLRMQPKVFSTDRQAGSQSNCCIAVIELSFSLPCVCVCVCVKRTKIKELLQLNADCFAGAGLYIGIGVLRTVRSCCCSFLSDLDSAVPQKTQRST